MIKLLRQIEKTQRTIPSLFICSKFCVFRTNLTIKANFEDIGAINKFGNNLLERITEIVSQNQIVPSLALKEMNELVAEVKTYFQKLSQVDDIFTEFEIEYDQLLFGDFEIGISLPHGVSGDTLENIEKEIHKIDELIRTFNELTCNDASSLKVNTIGSSEWQIFINSAPEVAACLAIAIERIVALYKNNLEIKVLKDQLSDRIPQKISKQIEDHIESTVKREIDKISEDIVNDKYTQSDSGRKNELKNKLSIDLTYLADRLDKGATFEVRAEPPAKPEDPEEGETQGNQAQEIERKEYERINALATEVTRISHVISALKRSEGPSLMIQHESTANDKDPQPK